MNQIVLFSRALHAAGVPVNPANLIDLCRSMSFIDISNTADFYAAARAVLVSSQQDITLFNAVFKEFWHHSEALSNVMKDSLKEPEDKKTDGDKKKPDEPEDSEDKESGGDKKKLKRSGEAAPVEEDIGQHGDQDETLLGYSPHEALMTKDFEKMTDQEIEQTRRLVAMLVTILANYQSRRRIASTKGKELNLRKMLKQNALYAQDGMKLLYRKKQIKKIKLMLLCDVSGSMERYSRFLIQFIYAMRQQLASLEVAVFSTNMTVITDFLQHKSVEQSLRDVASHVQDWGGGTNIGNSLRQFNDRFGHEMIRTHTVVIILSDGWDRGDTALMREEIRHLHGRVKKLLWLNPLLNDVNYQPLCRGIQTALPFIDQFLPAHNLESFAQLIRHLRVAWR